MNDLTNTIRELLYESVNHDRYMRVHGKKAPNTQAPWMFTTKRMGDVDYNKPEEFYKVKVSTSLSAAAKEAQKALGTKDIYVMESTVPVSPDALEENFADALSKIGNNIKRGAKNTGIAFKNLTRGMVMKEDDIADLEDNAIKIARMTVELNNTGGVFTKRHKKIFSEVMTAIKRLSKSAVRADKIAYESTQQNASELIEMIQIGIINMANAIKSVEDDISEDTELNEELSKKDFESLGPCLDTINTTLNKIYAQGDWEKKFKTIEKLLGDSYSDLKQVYELSGKRHSLKREDVEVLESTYPKFNKEKETITFVNDAEARAAEKVFKANKIAVKMSGKKASFINTAEYKQAVAIVNDAAKDLKKKIFGEDIDEARVTLSNEMRKMMEKIALMVDETIKKEAVKGQMTGVIRDQLYDKLIGELSNLKFNYSESAEDIVEWTEYDEEVFAEDNKRIDNLVEQGLTEDEAINLVIDSIVESEDEEESEDELDEKRMSAKAKRDAAIYRKKNKVKLKKYRAKRAKKLKSGAIRVNKAKSRQIKKARKKPGISDSVDHGDTPALTEANISAKVIQSVKGSNGPWVVMALKDKRVVNQETVKLPDLLPAAVKVMAKDYPNHKIAIEDESKNKIVYNESKLIMSESPARLKVQDGEYAQVGNYVELEFGTGKLKAGDIVQVIKVDSSRELLHVQDGNNKAVVEPKTVKFYTEAYTSPAKKKNDKANAEMAKLTDEQLMDWVKAETDPMKKKTFYREIMAAKKEAKKRGLIEGVEGLNEVKSFDVEKEMAGFEKVLTRKKFKFKTSGSTVTITSGEAKGMSYEFSPEKIEGKDPKGRVWTKAFAKNTGFGQGEDMAKELVSTYK